MAGFGKRPWGSSPFGSLTSGTTGVPEAKQPSENPVFGVPVDSGVETPISALSLTDLEAAIRFGDTSTQISNNLISAYIQAFPPEFGTPTASTNVLKAKTWSNSPAYQAYDPGFIGGTADIGAIVKVASKGSKDLAAYLFAFGGTTPGEPQNLPATLQPLHTDDLSGLLAAIDAANLTGVIESIPGFNLPAQADPVPGVDLSASGGGHFPEDVPAYLAAVLPVDLPVFIRGGYADTLELAASLNQTGQLADLGAILKIALPGSLDLSAGVRVVGQGVKNLPAALQPYHLVDLPASIITQRIRDMRAIVKGFAPGTEDLHASVARIDSAAFDLNGYTLAQFIDLVDIAGKIRVVQLGGNDVPSSLTAVSPFFNINKVPLQFTPLINLDATLAPAGGFLSTTATITPVHHASTGTASDAGFVVTASSYRFYLGTSRGLYVPTQNIPQVRVSTYTNKYNLPDLHATIAGWNVHDLSASLRVAPYSELPAEVRVYGLDHLADLMATLSTFTVADLQATVSAAGAFTDVQGVVTSAGKAEDIGALLVPFIDPLSLSIISVSTQPIADLGALINYDSYVHCSPTSYIASLAAYIKPLVSGTPDNISNLSASILSNLAALDVSASIDGKKRTRIRILSLTFTAKDRGTERMAGTIVPLYHEMKSLAAEITGLSHEVDLPASIAPVRYALHDVDFTPTEKVVNLATGEVKDVLLSFKSQVQHYVYEEVTEAVYATDRGTWAIDLRTLAQVASFFDRDLRNREFVLTDLEEYYSLDEAIRAAIVVLCERRQSNLSASISARGMVADLSAQVTSFSVERTANLSSKIMPVANLPDIAASINTGTQSSSLLGLAAAVTPTSFQVAANIAGEVFGDVVTDITAEITVA